MDNDRNWMYRRLKNRFLTNEYCVGVESFVTFALSHPECLLNGNIRCPCNRKKCQNQTYLDKDTVKVHLSRYGFVPDYYNWYFHGEEYIRPFYPNFNMEAPSSSSYRVHTHRHVDERSRLVDQAAAYMNESLTPLDDGTIPSQPTSGEVNNMFSMVVRGPKKGRMYGCGSMASTIYPDEMARRPRGGSSSSSRGLQDTERMQAEWEAQKNVNEHLCIDLQATQSNLKATQTTLEATQHENASLKDRMTILEDQVRRLVARLPQPHPQPHTSRRFLYARDSSSRGRALAGPSHFDDPYAAGSSHHRHSGKVLRYSPEYIPPSQDIGHDDGDGDIDDAYDDDQTQ